MSFVLTADNLGVGVVDPSTRGTNDAINLVSGAKGDDAKRGCSEVHQGRLTSGRSFLATIEPWHGNQVVVYRGTRREKAGTSFFPVICSTTPSPTAMPCGSLMSTATATTKSSRATGARTTACRCMTSIKPRKPGSGPCSTARWPHKTCAAATLTVTVHRTSSPSAAQPTTWSGITSGGNRSAGRSRSLLAASFDLRKAIPSHPILNL